MYGHAYQPDVGKVTDFRVIVQYVRTLCSCEAGNSISILDFRAAYLHPGAEIGVQTTIRLLCAGSALFPLYLAADDMADLAVILLCTPGVAGNMAIQGTVHPFGPGHRGIRRQSVCRHIRFASDFCVASLKEGTRTRETHHRTQAG